ncbi:MAG TPA: AraC family transcriptional regulator [Chitinophagaceae bacterium]|nr:AraC family transcriptional regulator [Chitinophagaceae bacterium]
MEIAIKNMVCGRCIKVVKEILNQLAIPYTNVELGRIHFKGTFSAEQAIHFKERLLEEGFDVVEDQKLMIVERIKNLIIDLVYNKDLEEWNENLSSYLSDNLHKDYTTLSQLFSSVENTTIEQYFILQKLERVKEMLVYDDLSLSEIAFKMGYSSVAHLSTQFKRITGFTPTAFKELKEHKKQFIDRI